LLDCGCPRPGLIMLALVTALVVVVPTQVGWSAPSPAPTPAPTPGPAPSPSPTPAPTPGTAPSPTPAPATTPSPGVVPSPGPSPTPGPPPTVVEVVVRGLEHVPESVVLDSIGVRAGELLSDERLRADVAAIVATGWFADANVRVEPFRDGVRVAFLVVENPLINEIVIEGNTRIPTPDLVRALDVPTGQVLNITRLRDGARAVERLYEERGYALARVVDAGVVANGATRLRLRIAEGRIEAIQYTGLVKTRQYVVERYRRFQPGDILNVNDLNAYLQLLIGLELFENVQARPLPGSGPEAVIIEIEIKEQPTQQARFGVGYSDLTGIVGLIEYSEKNWRGRYQQITVRYERGLTTPTATAAPSGPIATNFLVTFREPYLDARGTSLDLSLYQATTVEAQYDPATREVSARFNLDRLGSAAALSRRLDPQTTLTLRFRSERALITALPVNPDDPDCEDPNSPLCPKPPPTLFSPGRVVALALTGVRDRRDSPLRPTRGNRATVSVEFGVPALGGNFGFGKYTADYTQYFPGGSGVYVARGLVGFSHGSLPLQEQFVLGGPTTLRAYPGGFIRGPSAVLLSLEYRLPLGFIATQLQEFTGILFADVGVAPISTNILAGYGVGFTVNTPLGAIRVDYAIGSRGSQTWLTIGQPF
jgi:outer membrane protein insertion porin family